MIHISPTVFFQEGSSPSLLTVNRGRGQRGGRVPSWQEIYLFADSSLLMSSPVFNASADTDCCSLPRFFGDGVLFATSWRRRDPGWRALRTDPYRGKRLGWTGSRCRPCCFARGGRGRRLPRGTGVLLVECIEESHVTPPVPVDRCRIVRTIKKAACKINRIAAFSRILVVP